MTNDDELLKRMDECLSISSPTIVAGDMKRAADRIRELKAESDRWEARCEKAWSDLDKMGFQGLYKAFGDGPTHAIVPVEPTEAMLQHGREAGGGGFYHLKNAYRAMIRAAQEGDYG